MSYVSFVMVGSFNICDLENGEYLVISRDVEWGHGQQMLEIYDLMLAVLPSSGHLLEYVGLENEPSFRTTSDGYQLSWIQLPFESELWSLEMIKEHPKAMPAGKDVCSRRSFHMGVPGMCLRFVIFQRETTVIVMLKDRINTFRIMLV